MRGIEDFVRAHEIIASGDVVELEHLATILDDFPAGRGLWPAGPWVCLFAACAPPDTLRWALARGAPVDPEVDDGYPPLHSLLDEPTGPEAYDNLAILIAAGADVNRRAINGWTPLHLAAIRDDDRAMRMLLDAGADRALRTEIDDDATAEEEARLLGHHRSADFIRDYRR